MKLYPINKFIVVEPVEEKNTTTVLLPEGFAAKGDVKAYKVITVPVDCKIPEDCRLIALSNMVNKFTFEGTSYHVLPENAVIGYFAGI